MLSALLNGASASTDWAEIYDRFAGMEEPFLQYQLNALAIEPHHSVLDLGAGSGRLALPIARIVSRVTAIDLSRPLLDRLEARAADEGLNNITTVEADWDAITPRRTIRRHDVVVASRFTGMEDLMKLDAAANERVYVLMFSGPSTMALYRALLEGIAPPAEEHVVPRPGFARLFNALCELGIDPNVTHLPDGFSRWYENLDAAEDDFSWLGIRPQLRPILRQNLARFLSPEEGGVRFLFRTRSTLIWWEK